MRIPFFLLRGPGAPSRNGAYVASRAIVRKTELIWIGEQFRQAIGLYYQRSPGAVKRYPEKLEDLLEDKRYLSMQRYLRKIYTDPLSGETAWGLVAAPGGGIMGVYSTAEGNPLRSSPPARDGNSAAKAASYRDWGFVYEPPAASSPRPAKPSA